MKIQNLEAARDALRQAESNHSTASAELERREQRLATRKAEYKKVISKHAQVDSQGTAQAAVSAKVDLEAAEYAMTESRTAVARLAKEVERRAAELAPLEAEAELERKEHERAAELETVSETAVLNQTAPAFAKLLDLWFDMQTTCAGIESAFASANETRTKHGASKLRTLDGLREALVRRNPALALSLFPEENLLASSYGGPDSLWGYLVDARALERVASKPARGVLTGDEIATILSAPTTREGAALVAAAREERRQEAQAAELAQASARMQEEQEQAPKAALLDIRRRDEGNRPDSPFRRMIDGVGLSGRDQYFRSAFGPR